MKSFLVIIPFIVSLEAVAGDAYFAAAKAAGVDLEVDYCEASGHQYVDTGVVGRPHTKVEAKFSWVGDPAAGNYVLVGSRDGGENRFNLIEADNNGDVCLGVGDYFAQSSVDGSGAKWAINTDYVVISDIDSNSQTVTLGGTNVMTLAKSSQGTDLTLYLFASHDNRKENETSCFCETRLYYMKIWQDGQLVRDFVPAKSNGIYGLWDIVGGNFYSSAAASQLGGGRLNATVAPDYAAEWLEVDGTQFFDTGVVGRPVTKVEAKFQWMANMVTNDFVLIGSRDGSGGRFNLIEADNNGDVCLGVGDYFAKSSVDGPGFKWEPNTDYTVVSEIGTYFQTISVNGSNIMSLNKSPQDTDRPLYVFACNDSRVPSSVTALSEARLYYMKIWQDNVLVRDFTPGVRNGKGCLYDKISGTCFFCQSVEDVMIGPPAGTPTGTRYALSYLGSAGGQVWVDTGVVGRPNTKVEARFSWSVDPAADNFVLIGSRDGNENRFNLIESDNNGDVCLGVGDYFAQSSVDGSGVKWARNTDYVVVSEIGGESQTITVDGSNVMTLAKSPQGTNLSLYLFASHDTRKANGASCFCAARIHYVKIWQDGVLVRNYLPVIANNGGPYLYDKVTRTFHSGVGAGIWDVGEKVYRFMHGTIIVLR